MLYFIVFREIEGKKDIALVWGYHCCIFFFFFFAKSGKRLLIVPELFCQNFVLIFFLNIIIPSDAVLFRMGETTLEDSAIADAMFVMMSLPVYSVKSKGIT